LIALRLNLIGFYWFLIEFYWIWLDLINCWLNLTEVDCISIEFDWIL
jgi:hypothetical protein